MTPNLSDDRKKTKMKYNFKTNQVMYAILSTVIDIVRSLRPIFGILASFYYVYGLFGMQLFANKIRIDSFDRLNRTSPEQYCGTYEQLNYWPINFNDF